MSSPRMVSTREIAGHAIKAIRYDTWPGAASGGGALHTNVVIELDDGSRLLIMAEESANGGDYGTFVWRIRPMTPEQSGGLSHVQTT
jgi:hypothetical protein